MPRAVKPSNGRELVTGSLTRALVLSLLLHFAGIAGLELGRQLGWWNRSVLARIIPRNLVDEVLKTAEERAEAQRQLPLQAPEAELIFVDVDPEAAALEPPKDTPLYSTHQTRASNRTPEEEKEAPKLDGTQENIIKTFDTVRAAPSSIAVQPAPAPEQERPRAEVIQPAPQPPVQPAPAPETPLEQLQPAPPERGETLLARALPRAQPEPRPDNPPPEEPPRRRPRTVAEAKAQKGIIEAPKMRQQGGARLGATDGMDVKATPFGTYDAMFIEAVQSRWFALLDERDYVGNQAGKVVVQFRLHPDGRISGLGVVSASVNEMLSWFCQRAILDPAPYRPFPSDLRRMMQNDYREIRFTFYYNQ